MLAASLRKLPHTFRSKKLEFSHTPVRKLYTHLQNPLLALSEKNTSLQVAIWAFSQASTRASYIYMLARYVSLHILQQPHAHVKARIFWKSDQISGKANARENCASMSVGLKKDVKQLIQVDSRLLRWSVIEVGCSRYLPTFWRLNICVCLASEKLLFWLCILCFGYYVEIFFN